MSGIDRDSAKGRGRIVRIKIELLDSNNNAIFTWKPTSPNVARGLRKAAEVAVEKMGVDLEKEGLTLINIENNGHEVDMDPDYAVMVQGAINAGVPGAIRGPAWPAGAG